MQPDSEYIGSHEFRDVAGMRGSTDDPSYSCIRIIALLDELRKLSHSVAFTASSGAFLFGLGMSCDV